MKKFLFIILSFCILNIQAQNPKFRKAYTEGREHRAVGITFTFLGAGFVGCGLSYYNYGGQNYNPNIRPAFLSVGGMITASGVITLLLTKRRYR